MKYSITPPEFKKAFALITVLSFMWGLSYGLIDVLNKHFQEVLGVTKTQSGYIQLAYFGAYFCAAIPAGLFMNRFGYKAGIIMGLCFFASGAFLTLPATSMGSFYAFLGAFFILASGLSTLETAANPYATVLGPKESAVMRINVSQCFNGVGQFFGPIIGGIMFFSEPARQVASAAAPDLSAVRITYIVIGVVVLLLALLIFLTPLPDVGEYDHEVDQGTPPDSLFERNEFVFGVIANFFYIAAQVGCATFFINLTVECMPGSTSQTGAFLLSLAMGCFLFGRLVGTGIMTKVKPEKLVSLYGLCAACLSAVVFLRIPYVSVIALIAAFFFMSIIFPTIFALGLRNLGTKTKIGSSCMIMSIVGGAFMPTIMGRVADGHTTASAYALPIFCFLVVSLYGLCYNRLLGDFR